MPKAIFSPSTRLDEIDILSAALRQRHQASSD